METAGTAPRLVIGHKADTLERLSHVLTSARIDPFLCVGFEEWQVGQSSVLARIAAKLPDGLLIVRSCFSQEDSWAGSRAGAYLSRGGVDAGDRATLAAAIDAVFASYPARAGERVMVQRQVTDVSAAGVAMLRSMVHDGPYYVIEYDAVSGRTDTVTSGQGAASRTIVVHRDSVDSCNDRIFHLVLPVLREIETLAGCKRLEVEFALDKEGSLHVFQVRPMPSVSGTVADARLAQVLAGARTEFEKRQKASAPVLGHRAIFGIMPDWNPAEIIGTAPRRLALDLYRDLITDGTWAQQRAQFGYRDLGECALLADFAGRPFVDVRASLTSFVPASLPDSLATRLVDHYLDHLAANPQFHDKLEFEVAITCLAPDFPRHASRLADAGFTQDEIGQLQSALMQVTCNAWQWVARAEGALRGLEKAVTGSTPGQRVRALLDGCRAHGTLPFAHLARCGFVATTILRGLVQQGALLAEQQEAFLASLVTVARQLVRDAEAVAAGTKPWSAFVDAYGHLRPDTYEITAPRYDRNVEKFLRPLARISGSASASPASSFRWPQNAAKAISESLAGLGLPSNVAAFEGFARRAIEGRERGKFLFTRLLSDVLEEIAQWGESAGISREQLSHAGLHDILAAMDGTLPVADLRTRSEAQARDHALSLAVELPALLLAAGDFHVFTESVSQPSFVGHEDCLADCILITGDAPPPREALAGRIILVERADPGWDWLFGCGIAGLVTAIGGANSHIVVRAAELSLPSAIGIGEHRLRELSGARRMRIAPRARILEAIA